MIFASVNHFAAIRTHVYALCGGLDALTVGTRRRWFGFFLSFSFLFNQRGFNLVPDIILTEFSEIIVNTIPIAKFIL
jgi:hypothetical protein